MEGDIKLPLPQYIEKIIEEGEQEDSYYAQNLKLVEQLEEVVMMWERHMIKVLETYNAKVTSFITIFRRAYSFVMRSRKNSRKFSYRFLRVRVP